MQAESREAANRLILGVVQQAVNTARVTTKVVEVATGVIAQAGKGDASGTGQRGVKNAISRAFDAMSLKPFYARSMQNDLSDEAATVR